MTDEADDEPSAAEIAAERSLMRIFCSFDAYEASLPRSTWEQGDNGWVSYSRD